MNWKLAPIISFRFWYSCEVVIIYIYTATGTTTQLSAWYGMRNLSPPGFVHWTQVFSKLVLLVLWSSASFGTLNSIFYWSRKDTIQDKNNLFSQQKTWKWWKPEDILIKLYLFIFIYRHLKLMLLRFMIIPRCLYWLECIFVIWWCLLIRQVLKCAHNYLLLFILFNWADYS